MAFMLEYSGSDSPLVDTIWRARSEAAGSFMSVASCHWELVVSQPPGGPMTLTVRGPETRATPLSFAPDGEWFGIRFRLGSMLPAFPVANLVDGAVALPTARAGSFWLRGVAWPVPDFGSIDGFIDRLVRTGELARDPVVEAALSGAVADVPLRSVQRRIRQVTGLSRRTVRQIERARQAMWLLQQGVSILDTVHETGYYDQAHLTRALRRWMGQTPAHIQAASVAQPYKTAALGD